VCVCVELRANMGGERERERMREENSALTCTHIHTTHNTHTHTPTHTQTCKKEGASDRIAGNSALYVFTSSTIPLKIIKSTSARAVLLFPCFAVTVTHMSNRSLVRGRLLSLPASCRSPFQSCRRRQPLTTALRSVCCVYVCVCMCVCVSVCVCVIFF
jgi:hypothetical protein